MDVDGLTKLGFGGIATTFGIRLVWQWLGREKQDNTLYRTEKAAHDQTKSDLAAERQLRKDVEMQLLEERQAHDKDREAWYVERDKDRVLREQLRDEIFQLRTEVKKLENTINNSGMKLA